LTYAIIPLAAFGVALVCLVLLLGRVSMVIGFVGVACLAAVVLRLASPGTVYALLRHASTPGVASLRTAIWRTTLDMIRHYPFTGIGCGSNRYMALEPYFIVPEQTTFEPEPHNGYLELDVYGGIQLAVIYILLIGPHLKEAIRSVRKLTGASRA